MANVMQSLFGLNLPQQQQAAPSFNPLGNLSAMGAAAGASLRQNIAGAFGQQTPQQALSSIIQQTQQQTDLGTPEGLVELANNLNQFPQFSGIALAMRQEAAKLGQEQTKFSYDIAAKGAQISESAARMAESEARIKKQELSAAQEEKLRTELSALGPNASERDIIRVVTKYGTPDKILQVLQQAENVKLAKEQTTALRAQKASMLPASLQKDEVKDLEAIDNYISQSEALGPSILNLTPDSAGVRKLELGPIKNAKYAAMNLAGNSTPESRAYEALKSAVDTAVNLQVSAEKGVQTDKDVLRFAQALIAAYGRNDTQATLEALQRYQDALNKARTRTETRIDSRRRSQGVQTYFGSSGEAPGTANNPIILK
jgi:hypothetical protein